MAICRALDLMRTRNRTDPLELHLGDLREADHSELLMQAENHLQGRAAEHSLARRACRAFATLVEQIADGFVPVDATDGFAKQLCDGNGRQVRQPVRPVQRTGICHDNAVHARAFQSFDGRAAEYRVSCSEVDPSRSVGPYDFNRAADGAGGRNHVIKNQRGLAFNRPADQVGLSSFQRVCSALVNDRQ